MYVYLYLLVSEAKMNLKGDIYQLSAMKSIKINHIY